MTAGIDSHLLGAVDRSPDHAAFRCGGKALSYADLHRSAGALAQRLRDHGVGPGDRVAIAMTKGLEMPVAIYGIWMAGAAFVPFDTFAPLQRLAGLIDACDIRVVVGSARDAAVGKKLGQERPVTLVNASEVLGADTPVGFQEADNRPEDLAYVMFTSGSTGDPKGIVHTHGSGTAFARMWTRLYRPTPDDVLFCTVPLHFDFSLADFFAAPLGGATTELVPEPLQRFPASLAQLLETSRASIWSTVPFALIHLLEHGDLDARDLGRMRWIIYGGEAMSPAKLYGLRRYFPAAQVSNSYGPAEVNQCTEYTVPADHPQDAPIPIGRPTDHADLVEDDGELLIATPAMMQGYWRRPDLNAKAFSVIDGKRYYRTGDSARLGEDGLWHFGGRSDRQVKVRGYRIELDEIEHALAAHPAVSEAAVVLAKEDETIRSYVIASDGADVTADDLRVYLRSILPPYTVPAVIAFRSAFPRTGTGKIDRKVLEVTE